MFSDPFIRQSAFIISLQSVPLKCSLQSRLTTINYVSALVRSVLVQFCYINLNIPCYR